jgi:hypothetical protein
MYEEVYKLNLNGITVAPQFLKKKGAVKKTPSHIDKLFRRIILDEFGADFIMKHSYSGIQKGSRPGLSQANKRKLKQIKGKSINNNYSHSDM